MRRYASSKFRIALFLLLMAAAMFISSPGKAQTNAAGASGAPAAGTQHTGLFQVIMSNKDPVFFLIMACSVTGVTLIIQGFIKNRRDVLMPEQSIQHIRELINQRQFKELIEYTESDPTFVSRALNPALKRAPSFGAMKEAMETAIGEQTAEHFRKIEYLNILGNLGPLLGLLGTVLGMIEAFSAMSDAGKEGASPANLAAGISKALAHTFLGLMLAVPCLSAFGILRTIVDRLTIQASLIAEELLLMIKPAEAKPAGVAAAAARPGATPQPAAAPPGLRKGPMPAPPPAPAV
jgi:biopolymer transport protein ExbB